MLRLSARAGALPLGLVFGGIGSAAAAAVALLGLDRLPFTLCVFKAALGWPCLTCGSTRVLGRLADGDLAGALALNPLATLGMAALMAWALADAMLAPSRRALVLDVAPAAAWPLRWAAGTLLVLNWAWLVAAGV